MGFAMSYSVVTGKTFDRKFRKLDFVTQRTIMKWVKSHLQGCENPRAFGKALTGDLKGLWRYRIGDYRLIVDIMDSELVIVAVDIGHRREVYR